MHFPIGFASFVRSGAVHLNYGYVKNAGVDGSYWSRSANSNTNDAYVLYFGNGHAYPSTNTTRDSGRSLRCLQE